jgi:predicted transcriptional regulator
MPITYEKMEALFEEKFQEALKPLTKQIENVMKKLNSPVKNTMKLLDY